MKKVNKVYLSKTCLPVILILLLSTIAPAAQKTGKTGPEELNRVLRNTAAYCEKLKAAVFHFFCREKLHETVEKSIKYTGDQPGGLKNFLKGTAQDRENQRWSSLYTLRRANSSDSYKSKKRVKSNTYVNDYQIIKQNNRIREKRMTVSVNGKKLADKKAGGGTFLYSFKNAITPIYLFAGENQRKYRYSLSGMKNMKEGKAYIVEISRKDKEGGKVAVAWVDSRDFSIMKIDVLPGGIEGYDKLLNAKKNKMFDLEVLDTHIFGYSRQGIRYPTKTRITLAYKKYTKSIAKNSKGEAGKKNTGGIVSTKIDTTITYGKYLFYGVSVDDPVFK